MGDFIRILVMVVVTILTGGKRQNTSGNNLNNFKSGKKKNQKMQRNVWNVGKHFHLIVYKTHRHTHKQTTKSIKSDENRFADEQISFSSNSFIAQRKREFSKFIDLLKITDNQNHFRFVT